MCCVAHLGVPVVRFKRRLQLRRGNAHLCREVGAGCKVLHDTARDVVLAVPLEVAGGGRVEDEAVRPFVVGPHAAGDVVALANVVGKTVAVPVDKDTAFTAQGFGSKELGLVVRVVRVDKTSRVHLCTRVQQCEKSPERGRREREGGQHGARVCQR